MTIAEYDIYGDTPVRLFYLVSVQNEPPDIVHFKCWDGKRYFKPATVTEIAAAVNCLKCKQPLRNNEPEKEAHAEV